jgi:hypothetical protein
MLSDNNGSADSEEQQEREREERRVRLLDVVASSTPETLEHRVAWILNNYPETRDSDVALQLRYWETFHYGEYNPTAITPEDLYQLPRLTSLTRARARIQNQLRLFLATEEVRRRRGTLEEEERETAVKRSKAYPVYAVYIDESGKTQSNLLMGSMWVLHGPETWRIASRLRNWRDDRKFHNELHFSDVKPSNLSYYKESVDLVVQSGSAVSFKVITVPRAGTGAVQGVVPKLIYQLLVKGIEHENRSGRAPLPRNLQVWKDSEEAGYDKLILADLEDRIKVAASTQFQGKLFLDAMQAAHSKGNDLIQIADLFTGSINRVVNPPDPPPSTPSAKDELSSYVISRLKISVTDTMREQYEDLAVRLIL